MQHKVPYVIILLLLANITLNAQLKKGMRMVGASAGSAFFNSGKSDYSYPPPTTGYTFNSNNFGITLNPSMGWFVSDNTAIGALLNVGYTHQKTFAKAANGNIFNRDISNSLNIGIGGFARNYFKSSGRIMPFGQFNLNFGIGSTDNEGFYFINNDKSTYDGKSFGNFFINTGLVFGFTKMLNANTGLDFFGGYTYSYNKREFKTTTLTDLDNNGSNDQTAVSEPTQKFTNHGVSIGVGFQVFLDKKKR
jgi:hypothetical protein